MIKISVITINYNDAKGLRNTIQSVISQDYQSIEYIIVDGGSTDESLSVIKEFKIKKFVSELDNGIYDAMNKGLFMATGEFVIFMNSGDIFSTSTVVSEIFSNNNYDACDVIYGNSTKVSADGKKVVRTVEGCLDELRYHPIYRHGASFTRRSFHLKYMFDLSRKDLGYALDYHCIYRMYKTGGKFTYRDVCIMDYLEEGTSNNALKNIRYNYLISISDGWTLSAFIQYTISVTTYIRHKFLSIITSKKFLL